MTPAARWLLGVSLMASAPAIVAQQTPARDNTVFVRTGTASLSGTIVNDLTSRPVRRANITLSNTDFNIRLSVITDDTGTFTFNALPAGRYYLGGGRPGFVGTSYGAKRPNRPGTTIALTEGQRRTGVTLRMQPGAVITGTVRNAAGEPVPGVRVAVLRQSFGYDTGERTLAGVGPGLGEATDDRGEYRVFGLAPDEYFVVVTNGIGLRRDSETREITQAELDWAMRQIRGAAGAAPPAPTPPPEPGRSVDYAPVFYPGVFTRAAASSVVLKAGEERTGVDVVLALTPTAKVTGTVTSPDGVLPPNLTVNVVQHDPIPGIPFSGFGTARVDKDGKFVNAGLPPGDYTITVRAGGAPGGRAGVAPGGPTRFGTATVTIDGRDVDTTVSLESGVTVSGRLVFDGTTMKAPDNLRTVRVSLTAVRSSVPTIGVGQAQIDAAGAFTFVGVTPGRYRVSAYGAGAWQVKSAIVGGRDALDVPIGIKTEDVAGIDLTFTDRPTEITGNLLDAAGQPAPEYFIIVYPADKTFWTPQSRRIVSVRPASDGHFKAPNLPPGDYLIAAVTDVEQGEWYDPSFLAQLVSASTKITLAEGEKKVQNLKLGGGM